MRIFFWAVVLSAAAMVTGRGAEPGPRQYYELRVYTLSTPAQQKRVTAYWQKAGVPAYNRLGVKPVGVFSEIGPAAANKVYVLLPFASLEAFAAASGQLAADAGYQRDAADYLAATKLDPAYDRFDSSLNAAFDGAKQLMPPPASAALKPWVFELRYYLSPSEGKARSKIQMFESGEIPLMKEVGLCPVFFSRTIAGSQMPNLVYMVSGETLAIHKQHWVGFSSAPTWKALKSDPQYKDNVSKVISIFLQRAPGSQL